MCGIAGIISKTGNPHPIETILMQQHQHMRGPDDRGTVFHNNHSFTFNRLAIMDTSSAGMQPMETDRWILLFNGEIYNHQLLRTGLNGREWKSSCDAETLLCMIHGWGVEMTLEMIEGMFAFAAYDKKLDVLWLAVDPMGIKPLYYFSDERIFAFASSPAALTHCKDKWDFDEDALADFLALGGTYQPLFKGMKKIMPGTVMRREASGRTGFRQYKRFEHEGEMNPEDVLKVTLASIKATSVADVPSVLFLSGGIDSSVVASQCPGMRAVHLNSEEVEFAKEVGEKYGNELMIINAEKYNAQECLEDYARQSGDCSMAALIPYMVSKHVAKVAKVAISANGADELFFGYNRMSQDEQTLDQFNHIFRGPISGGTVWDTTEKRSSRQLELESYVQFDLNKTLDFASMCHGLEVRVPYLNRLVVDSAMSLPRSKHVKGDYTKLILKEFLRKEGFSERFLRRPKIGFSLFAQPEGNLELQYQGMEFLKQRFKIHWPHFNGRDKRYTEASAAAFLCWWNIWESKLNPIKS